MSFLKKSFFVLVFLLFFAALKAQAVSKSVFVTIDNPDGPLVEARVTFFIPFNLTPIDLRENMTWNATARELVINLGGFKEKESKTAVFTLDGPAGRYLLNGKVVGRWPATDLRPEENFEETIENFAVILGPESGSALSRILDNLRSTPELTKLSENITKPVSAVLGAVGIGAVFQSAVSASATFAAGLSKFFTYLALGFLRLRRRKPWGRVYNYLTGKPIEGASVKILDSKFKKIKDSQITDAEGRFGFLVPPGEYYIKISKRGFVEKETPVFKVIGPAQILNLEISLESLQTGLKAQAYRILKIFRFLLNALNRLSPWIIAIGTILSVYTVIITPSVLNYVVLGVYGVLIILKIIFRETFFKSFGWVLDRSDEKPLALAVVRIFDANKNWLLGTRVTDHDGRFNFLIGPGDYYVTATKEGYKPLQSQSTHFTKHGLISYDIKLERQS